MVLIKARFYLTLFFLCTVHDILFFQEHWLAPFDLDKLNTFTSDMLCFASSAMSDLSSRDCLIGRPFGGVAIYVRRIFASIAKLVSSSKHYIIVLLVNCCLLMFIYPVCLQLIV